MADSMMSFKELYDVSLKLTYPIEIGGKSFEENEVIARFDKIQVAGLNQVTKYITANGGFDNRAHVFWEDTKEIQLTFTQGVFSKIQFALMSNSKLFTKEKEEKILISHFENKESGEDGSFELTYIPVGKVFIYTLENREKIVSYVLEGKKITLEKPYMDVVVEYEYEYINGAKGIKIGQRLVEGFLKLEGKTRVKDDITGQEVTGLIKIPKLKLMSDLSIRLGTQANPVVGKFNAVGVPVGSRGNSYVSEFYFLNNDIDSDF